MKYIPVGRVALEPSFALMLLLFDLIDDEATVTPFAFTSEIVPLEILEAAVQFTEMLPFV